MSTLLIVIGNVRNSNKGYQTYQRVDFCRITIHAFHASDLMEGKNYMTTFTNLT